LWNPIIGVLVFAFITKALASVNNHYGEFVMLGIVLWNIIWDGEYTISVGALWEVWSRSFSNMFITPLTLEEFLVGQMISSIIKSTITVAISSVIAYQFFHFSILSLGILFLLYCAELLVFSWGIGMLVLSLIFRFGTMVQSLSWAIIFLLQPFGGVFYPVTVLPEQIRWLAYSVPTTYLFESMRQQIVTGKPNGAYLVVGSVLTLVYFLAGYVILQLQYRLAKENGSFARMEGVMLALSRK
jgi:ABC-2 type transport system permease protein